MKKADYIHNQLNNKKKAFTLIELLIVIAVIGILFIVIVSRVDFATDKAKTTGVQTDFRSFQMAFDTVARENAGFNTFGFDMGDNGGGVAANSSITINGKTYTYTNADKDKGDGIRNSYDEGDTNLDGKNVGETWTGRKVYTETWTDVWTFVKPGTTIYDTDAIFALESAINKNLDPKLHITIASDGKITMANQARDPWKNEYHGVYITNAENDKGDRGAIVMYSNGANGKWGSAHVIENGVVTVGVPGNNVDGKDDYSLVSCYTFTNGYGEVLNLTTGFSNNQNFMAGNASSLIPGNQSPDDNNSEPHIAVGTAMFNDGVTLTWEELMLPENGTKYGYNAGNIKNDMLLSRAFSGCQNIIGINIPPSVTKIGERAFYGCKNLTDVIMPNSVTTTTDYGIFGYCTNLINVQLSENITSIPISAFYGCSSLTKIVIPDSVKSIGSNAFSDCKKLTDVSIGNGVETIDDEAFLLCDSLVSIVIPDSVTTIGKQAFCNDEKLTNVSFGTGLETVDENAFAYCNLNTVILHDGLISINTNAFYNCDNLTSIVIPDSVTSIGKSAFEGCMSLTSVMFGENSQLTSIPKYAFSGCTSLVSVTIPDSVTSIGDCAFQACTNLTLAIGNNIETIGQSAFARCDLITHFTIPDLVTNLSGSLLYSCDNLQSVEIPQNVTNIDYRVFEWCKKLQSIEYNGTIEQWNAITKHTTWADNTGTYTIYCTNGSIAKDGTITYN